MIIFRINYYNGWNEVKFIRIYFKIYGNLKLNLNNNFVRLLIIEGFIYFVFGIKLVWLFIIYISVVKEFLKLVFWGFFGFIKYIKFKLLYIKNVFKKYMC